MHRPFYGAVLVSAILCFLAGCASKDVGKPDTFVILIDKSASINEAKSAAYIQYLQKDVFPSLTPEARVIIEPVVGANTFSDPALRVVKTLPIVTALKRDAGYYLFTGDMSQNKECTARVNEQLPIFDAARSQLEAEALRVFHAKGSSPNTFLVDGMREASEYLEQRKGRGILIVLSDGLEDSDEFGRPTKFDSEVFWSKQKPVRLVNQLDPSHAVPGLKGTNVYFFGMAAGKGKVYENVRNFWTSFFRAALVQSVRSGHQPIYDEPPYRPKTSDLCK